MSEEIATGGVSTKTSNSNRRRTNRKGGKGKNRDGATDSQVPVLAGAETRIGAEDREAHGKRHRERLPRPPATNRTQGVQEVQPPAIPIPIHESSPLLPNAKKSTTFENAIPSISSRVVVLSNSVGPSNNDDANGAKKKRRNRNRKKRPDGENVQGEAGEAMMIDGGGDDGAVLAQETTVDEGGKGGPEKPTHFTDYRFVDLQISNNTKRAIIEVMRYEFLTQVQYHSLPVILEGRDVLVKAKTGTGKTLGFLIPAIEVLTKAQEAPQSGGQAPRILVLSPTRELAQQIASEASILCKHHRLGVMLMVGGTKMTIDTRAIKQSVPGNSDIIVATPGRLLAHLQETNGFADQCLATKVLVMDEADRLLDMGFKRDIDQIIAILNRDDASRRMNRQTLLFSATVPVEVQQVAHNALQPGYQFVDTVGDEVEQTHEHVPQKVINVPLDRQLEVMVKLLEDHITRNLRNYKVIMFFTTARQTQYAASILNTAGFDVMEIHSRKSQPQRTSVSERFRNARCGILASSDVSARGMDYPDVTFVLQVGSTTREQYIHRLGRTARAGKDGVGTLMLAPFEFNYMTQRELVDLPLHVVSVDEFLNMKSSEQVRRAHAAVAQLAEGEANRGEKEAVFGEDKDRDVAKMAWTAWVGYYNGLLRKIGWTKTNLIEMAEEYARSMGFMQIPTIPKRTIGKMGLQGVPGLRIEEEVLRKARGGAGRGGGRGNGR